MEDFIYISVHRRRKTDRNPYVADVILLTDSDYGCWVRIMHHRGTDPIPLAKRLATHDEEKIYEQTWRMPSLMYKTWEGLIYDEYAVTNDIEWTRRLYDESGIKLNFEKVILKRKA